MKLGRLFLICLCGLFILVSCSSNKQEEKSIAGNNGQSVEMDMKTESLTKNSNEIQPKEGKDTSSTNKVIYTAVVDLEVKNFDQANKQLENLAKKYGGYTVQSNVYRAENQQLSASITLRIPEQFFQGFLEETEKLSTRVKQKQVSGTDVTEEYVDLEARLNSKKAVENRLLEFMKQATTTEDLLKISSDLAAVQEQIEQISGRIKYLDNQIAYSTVTVNLVENKITVPGIDNKELNTWEKTKKQFMTSINFLLSAFSGMIVFIFGNLPILLLMGIIVSIIYYFIKGVKKD